MNLQPVGKDKINHISNEDLENELIWWANQRDYNLSKTVAHNLMTPRLKRLWSFIIRFVVNKLKKLDISDLIMLNNTELLANYKKEKLSTSNQQLRKSELLSKLYQLKTDLKDQNDKVDQLFNITSEKELSLRQSENDLLDVQSRLQIKMEHKKSLILLIHKIKSMNDSLQRVGKQESIGLQEVSAKKLLIV
ncbi:hypothetical protein HDV02_005584 [Globomyces sp. JEL0801]|nr:hypothetical protein HDV02_005584 [Globomyces sp. JEL0801]